MNCRCSWRGQQLPNAALCHRPATQEDGLCDWCRENADCRKWRGGELAVYVEIPGDPEASADLAATLREAGVDAEVSPHHR